MAVVSHGWLVTVQSNHSIVLSKIVGNYFILLKIKLQSNNTNMTNLRLKRKTNIWRTVLKNGKQIEKITAKLYMDSSEIVKSLNWLKSPELETNAKERKGCKIW